MLSALSPLLHLRQLLCSAAIPAFTTHSIREQQSRLPRFSFSLSPTLLLHMKISTHPRLVMCICCFSSAFWRSISFSLTEYQSPEYFWLSHYLDCTCSKLGSSLSVFGELWTAEGWSWTSASTYSPAAPHSPALCMTTEQEQAAGAPSTSGTESHKRN